MLEKIQQWYCEAAILHGDDWPSVEAYVARKIALASSADRTHLLEQMQGLLGDKSGILH
jgi:hypothetical protein